MTHAMQILAVEGQGTGLASRHSQNRIKHHNDIFHGGVKVLPWIDHVVVAMNDKDTETPIWQSRFLDGQTSLTLYGIPVAMFVNGAVCKLDGNNIVRSSEVGGVTNAIVARIHASREAKDRIQLAKFLFALANTTGEECGLNEVRCGERLGPVTYITIGGKNAFILSPDYTISTPDRLVLDRLKGGDNGSTAYNDAQDIAERLHAFQLLQQGLNDVSTKVEWGISTLEGGQILISHNVHDFARMDRDTNLFDADGKSLNLKIRSKGASGNNGSAQPATFVTSEEVGLALLDVQPKR